MQSENEIGIMSNKYESEMYVKEKYKREMWKYLKVKNIEKYLLFYNV